MEGRTLRAAGQTGSWLLGEAAGRPASIRKGLDAHSPEGSQLWFSHWVTAAHPRITLEGRDICQNSAWHMVGALQTFREGEEEYRRVAHPGSCPRRTLTSTQRKPVLCDCLKNCIEMCLRGGGRGATSHPFLLHGEDAEIRDSIRGPKLCLPWCARKQQQQ